MISLVVIETSRRSSRVNSRRKVFASSRLGEIADSSAASSMNWAIAGCSRLVVISVGFSESEKNENEMSVFSMRRMSPSDIAINLRIGLSFIVKESVGSKRVTRKTPSVF